MQRRGPDSVANAGTSGKCPGLVVTVAVLKRDFEHPSIEFHVGSARPCANLRMVNKHVPMISSGMQGRIWPCCGRQLHRMTYLVALTSFSSNKKGKRLLSRHEKIDQSDASRALYLLNNYREYIWKISLISSHLFHGLLLGSKVGSLSRNVDVSCDIDVTTPCPLFRLLPRRWASET